jgi:hypothetical protein
MIKVPRLPKYLIRNLHKFPSPFKCFRTAFAKRIVVKTGFRVFSKTQNGILYNQSKGHLFYSKKNYPYQVSMLLQDVVTHRGDNTDIHHRRYEGFPWAALLGV